LGRESCIYFVWFPKLSCFRSDSKPLCALAHVLWAAQTQSFDGNIIYLDQDNVSLFLFLFYQFWANVSTSMTMEVDYLLNECFNCVVFNFSIFKPSYYGFESGLWNIFAFLLIKSTSSIDFWGLIFLLNSHVRSRALFKITFWHFQ
jgi:hypothetical protein